MANPVQPVSARAVVSITKSDTTVYQSPFAAFRVGTTAGDVKIRDMAGNTVTIPGVQVGEVVPISFDMLFSTDTTAAGFTGFRY
jgi:hypothetical protein